GDCLGAGSLLVLCSDLTIAADTARFGSPFADLPESNFALAALTMRLNRAKSWMLTGSVLDAQAAYAAGLVNRVVPEADLMTAVEGLSASTSEMPLDGVTMSKMLLQSVLDTHGVGRDFDLADHFAVHRWSPREAQA
ncbi:MAG: enoyl-CoA hydratase/isomerase family protein, partial [Mesorhizobium sp.]|nr:enoyl-CoA hydratase/isomerase family protein [Mesorhizobium sp.]